MKVESATGDREQRGGDSSGFANSTNMARCVHTRADLVLGFVPDHKLVNANPILHRMTRAFELRLARRMARLGTETAFEVLVKAKALEAKGRDIIHLEIGEPDFDTPRNIIEADATRCIRASRITGLRPA